jgi:hypothetical protein
LLLCEPPICYPLNRQTSHFGNGAGAAVELANPKPAVELESINPEEYVEYQKKSTEWASILPEFLRTRFLCSGVAGMPIKTEMTILKRVISLIPTDRYDVNQREKCHGPVLNGAILKIAKFLTDSKGDPFSLACEPGPRAEFIGDDFGEEIIGRVEHYKVRASG